MTRLQSIGPLVLAACLLCCDGSSNDDDDGGGDADVSIEADADAEAGADGGPDASGDSDLDGDAPPAPRHRIVVGDGAGAPIPRVHGHYELGGVYFGLSGEGALVEAMEATGFPSWRVSVGRWEVGTFVDPSCLEAGLGALEPGQTLDDVLDERDWFRLNVDLNGNGVADLEDTEIEENYDFTYFENVLSVVDSFGAVPFVSLDHMPRALSSGSSLDIPTCNWTHSNGISNAPPTDYEVYASAALHFIRHYIDGWAGGVTREDMTHWEIWNEPDIVPGAGFWTGTIEQWMTLYAVTAAVVHAYRFGPGAGTGAWDGVRIGGGSFATTDWLTQFFAVMSEHDVPIDFLSIHGYFDRAEEHRERLSLARAARDAAGPRYSGTELVYAEWGLDLDHIGEADVHGSAWAAAEQGATLIDLVGQGYSLAHRSLFYDMFGVAAVGIVRGDESRTPTYDHYVAFNALTTLDEQREVVVESDSPERFHALAASSEDILRVYLVQTADSEAAVEVSFENPGAWSVTQRREGGLEVVDSGSGRRAAFTLPPRGMALIEVEGP